MFYYLFMLYKKVPYLESAGLNMSFSPLTLTSSFKEAMILLGEDRLWHESVFTNQYTIWKSRSAVSFMSKLEHLVATHGKWALMSFSAFIFCTIRQPYGSAEISVVPAGANIL